MPDLSGQIALVTGANSGLGLESARALLSKGAMVVLACRTLAKAEQGQEQHHGYAQHGGEGDGGRNILGVGDSTGAIELWDVTRSSCL
jgi:NAD(P)-dependent dehydrogenase (short-subunit alcohol dehydrogenase family)